MISTMITFLITILIFACILFNLDRVALFDCEEYEQVPYRSIGGFFGGQVRTIEGNHDGYWTECVKGTKPTSLLFGFGEKRNG